MIKSENIVDLATALAMAQSEIKHALRDAENPYFKSNYATLASVWNACREALVKNGLSVVQTLDYAQDKVIVDTILLHASGQWIGSTLPLPRLKPDIQSLGSEITYARRYALAAMVGVAVEDDDGNQAVKDHAQPTETARPEVRNHVPTKSAPHMPSSNDGDPGEFMITFGKHTGKRLREIKDLAGWVRWMRSTESPGKEVKGKALEALILAEAFLGQPKPKVDIHEPPFDEQNPPPFDSDDDIPF